MTEDQLSKAEDLLRDPDSEDCERFASWYGADLIATVRRLQQPSRSEAQPSGYDGSKSLGERLCEALASAGLLTGLAGASPVINAQFEKAALTFTASLSGASPSSGDE